MSVDEVAGPAHLFAAATLVSQVFREASLVTGFVAHPGDWTRRFVVELVLDGWTVDLARADRFDERMGDHGQPGMDFGFAFDLRKLKSARGAALEVRLANLDVVLAHLSTDTAITVDRMSSSGAVAWQGGLRFSGWLCQEPTEAATIRGLIDETVIFECRSNGLKLIDEGGFRRPRPAFDVHVPSRFADGKVRQLHVIDGEGRSLQGSPVSFLAFKDGLAAVLHRLAEVPGERIRGFDFDKMFPQSLPFDAIATWSERFFSRHESMRPTRIALLFVGEDSVDASLESFKDSHHDWTLGVLPSPKADGRFNADDLAEFLEQNASDCSIVVMALAGTLLSREALDRFAGALADNTKADLAYCDVNVLREGPGPDVLPLAFASFDYERMLEQGHAGWCFAVRTNVAATAARDGADSLMSLFLKALGTKFEPETRPIHIPGFLATLPAIDREGARGVLERAVISHLAERGIRAQAVRGKGQVFASIVVKRAITAGTISVVMPTHNEAEEVRACIEHLRGLRTRHQIELIISDMASSEPALLRYLARLDMRSAIQVRTEGAYNLARALNLGAARATSRYILFLDPKVRLDEPDPLDDLMSRCSDPATAAVGPTLVWPDGIIQTSGLVLSHASGASPVGRGLGDSESGYGDLMSVAQDRSAVSAACLMVNRDDHVAVQGFDEKSFGRAYFAIDYGLRLRKRGRRIVATPHARVTCTRDGAFAYALSADNFSAPAYRRELETLRLRWGDVLNHDPFYSPLLALNGDLFSALAWPPRLQVPQMSEDGIDKPIPDLDTKTRKKSRSET